MGRKKRPPLFELARESRVQSARLGGGALDGGVAVEPRPSRAQAPMPAHQHAPTPSIQQATPAGAAAGDAAANDWRRWITPGRTLRVPVGYVFLSAAVLLATTLGAYVLGFRRGAVNRERELIALRGDAALGGPSMDPLLDRQAASPQAGVAPTNHRRSANVGVDAAEAARALGPIVAGASNATNPALPDAARDAAQARRDPLVIEDAVHNPLTPGLNYYIVDRLRPDEALSAARYLRLHGVEAGVFPEHLVFGGRDAASSLRLVVALRGFASGEVSSEASKRYAARIRDVGRRWRAEENSVSDFATMYAAKHQP